MVFSRRNFIASIIAGAVLKSAETEGKLLPGDYPCPDRIDMPLSNSRVIYITEYGPTWKVPPPFPPSH